MADAGFYKMREEEPLQPGRFRPLRVILAVLGAMLTVSAYANWYAASVSVRRYCKNPEQTLSLLESVVTKNSPAGDSSRRPYLIAAKLLYLIPQEEGETMADYQARLRRELIERCL
ncbi:MAG: hypothetical protein ACE5FO_13945 [Parvularculaceae bacterium]